MSAGRRDDRESEEPEGVDAFTGSAGKRADRGVSAAERPEALIGGSGFLVPLPGSTGYGRKRVLGPRPGMPREPTNVVWLVRSRIESPFEVKLRTTERPSGAPFAGRSNG